MKSPSSRRRVALFVSLVSSVVLWGEVLAAAGPKKIVTSGPDGSQTVVDIEKGTTTRSTCFTLISGDGTSRHVALPGALHVDADGRYTWTSEQLGAVAAALELEGRCGELAGVLLLRSPGSLTDDVDPRQVVRPNFGDGPTPIQRGKIGDVLDPDCGKCASGNDCSTKKKAQCCEHATDDSCMTCKVCTPAIEAVIP